jgi:acyl-CoA synthetase (AMP-forming)/AMP-acid ligase II
LIDFVFIDPVFYIFTSGTTGLPKAAVIKHSRLLFKIFYSLIIHFCRFLLASLGFICALGVKSDDILYNTLPLYHSLGMLFFPRKIN